jgi:hypothetical protein
MSMARPTSSGQRNSDVLGKHSGSESLTRRRARERGIDGSGLEQITATVDLTLGRFYCQFSSKEQLAAGGQAAGRFL